MGTRCEMGMSMGSLLWRPVDWMTDVGLFVWQGGWTSVAPVGSMLFVPTSPSGDGGGRGGGRITDTVPPLAPGSTRVVCLSDTHERHRSVDVPEGDILQITGDLLTINRHFSESYSLGKLRDVAEWLRGLPHKHKVFIAGNHDKVMESIGADAIQELFGDGCTYLEDNGVTLRTGAKSLSVWGTPYSRGSSQNDAFQTLPEERLGAIPAGLDILMTHGPVRQGVIEQLQPRLHVCGHIHGHYGVTCHGETVCVNASIMDGKY